MVGGAAHRGPIRQTAGQTDRQTEDLFTVTSDRNYMNVSCVFRLKTVFYKEEISDVMSSINIIINLNLKTVQGSDT